MDVWQITSMVALHGLVVLAVLQDFKEMRISNRLILVGLVISIVLQILGSGANQLYRILPNIIIPVAVLYLFYLMGAIGAGDIKLLSLIGSFLNTKELMCVIACSFVVGAFISLGKMVWERSWRYQMKNGLNYLFRLTRGELVKYEYRYRENLIHFSFSIMLGLLLVEAYRFV